MIEVEEKKPAKVMIVNWRDEQSIKDRIAAICKENDKIRYAAVMSHIIRRGLEAVENE